MDKQVTAKTKYKRFMLTSPWRLSRTASYSNPRWSYHASFSYALVLPGDATLERIDRSE
jgi:hypothetical protein